jgi:hypothetical protein
MNHAAGHGNLELLKWARENGCPWNDRTPVNAAITGKLETLEWLHENECPFNEDACRHAFDEEHWDCLEYLVDNELPGWEKYNEETSERYSRWANYYEGTWATFE